MIPFPIIIAAAAENSTVSDALPHVMGFAVVVVTLAVLWALCVITGAVIKKLMPATPEASPVVASRKTVADDAVAPETLVVIAAAVTAVTGTHRRIVSVQPHNPVWSQAGRQQIQSSHNIR
ncbi:MAG: hypothetical protein KJO21_11230 [Verrucomicrobiae bacterium]|nr:hypothetical protein [Verrucomicrobiae bacterium]NNJ42859.1 hypothetical protein [Akkermansiaceae bacterium]